MCRQPDFTQWAFLCEDGVGIEHVFLKNIFARNALWFKWNGKSLDWVDVDGWCCRWTDSFWIEDRQRKCGCGRLLLLSREMRGEIMSQKCQGGLGEKWPVSSPPDSKIKLQTKEGRASTTSSTNRHKKPDDIILLGAARARTDNRTPKKQLAATVQRQCIFKSSCFCVLPIF